MRFILAVPTPAKVLWAIRELRERRAYPDPVEDWWVFTRAWFDTTADPNPEPDISEYLMGKRPHHEPMRLRLDRDITRSQSALNALANEAASYQNTISVLLVAVGLIASVRAGHLVNAWWGLVVVWGLTAILVLLIRSHASPLSSLVNNYMGAGAMAADSITIYHYAVSLKDDILRYNTLLQRSRRQMALVSLLFVVYLVAAALAVTGLYAWPRLEPWLAAL